MPILTTPQGRLLQASIRVPRQADIRPVLLPVRRDVALAPPEERRCWGIVRRDRLVLVPGQRHAVASWATYALRRDLRIPQWSVFYRFGGRDLRGDGEMGGVAREPSGESLTPRGGSRIFDSIIEGCGCCILFSRTIN